MQDYYKILEISSSATASEIKKAYRKLALKYHPDKNQGDEFAEAKFKEIAYAYEVLSNIEDKKNYDSKYENASNSTSKSEEKETENPLTPNDFLNELKNIRNHLSNINPNAINKRNLFDTLNDLLSLENINFLIQCDDIYKNRLIIEEILICCKPLGHAKHPIQSFYYIEIIYQKLVKLAGVDNETIQKIYKHSKKNELYSLWDRFKGSAIVVGTIILFGIIFSQGNIETSNNSDNELKNGDLNNTFTDRSQDGEINAEQLIQNKKDSLISNGWSEQDIVNGQLSPCYNFKPIKSNIDNYLKIVVGRGTDVAIKIMNINTEKCVRYVFINSGSTYQIKNLPEGQYYLKIAYGKNWLSKVINGQCIGRFVRNAIYEKGEDILDYNFEYNSEGYRIPSYELSLDVIDTNISNSFNSKDISENEFNK